MQLCMTGFVKETSMVQGGEGLLQEKPYVMIIPGCATDERLAGALDEEDIIKNNKEESMTPGLSGPHTPDNPTHLKKNG